MDIVNISKYKKIYFGHQMKCAGMSIRNSLSNGGKNLVTPEGQSSHTYPKYINDLDTYDFKFTFIRNPFERYVSFFYFLFNLRELLHFNINKTNGRQGLSKNSIGDQLIAQGKVLPTPDGFKQYVKFCEENDIVTNDVATLTTFFDNITYDFVGRFENLKKDFDILCKRLDVKCELKNLNKNSHGIHWHYKDNYDKKTKDIITYYYKEDFKEFNYEF